MGRWRDSWAARNPSVRLAWPTRQTRLPLWFRATESSALMEVLPDTAAASAGSAGCSFTKGSLWRSLRQDKFQKRHESELRASQSVVIPRCRLFGTPPVYPIQTAECTVVSTNKSINGPTASNVFHRLVTLLHTWRRRVSDRRLLAGMCNRALQDIGLTRCDRECEPVWCDARLPDPEG